ncbi:AEC family transporter [Alicycliphilus denitrificans]|uniref:AEC family transporter n=1 Tax=Alicycliphilus denitrificans TaxID=179636 RepID=A0A420KAW8_9BURK|nr:AEC family transporter [Alicycliphilus denitrificans]RKJ96352.1 AEC family transporter [Alicycliphilus denitrificans]
MGLLAHIFGVTFPFFALVLCGFLVTRQKWIGFDVIPGLNFFVLYLALPCMLYRFSAQTPLPQLLEPGTATVYLLAGVIMLALAILVARRQRLSWNDAAFGSLVAAFPNSGFMGVPLLIALLGPGAAAPAIVTLSLDMVVTSSLCIALSRLDGRGGRGPMAAFGTALIGMASNPLPWAILLGVGSSASGLLPPEAMMRTIVLLADCASTVALFTLGCVLARTYRQLTGTPGKRSSSSIDVLQVVGLKLLIHPLLIWGLTMSAAVWSSQPDPFSALVLILVAALPSASNVPMLAERFGADDGRIALIVLLTTVCAFVSFSLVVAIGVPASALAP